MSVEDKPGMTLAAALLISRAHAPGRLIGCFWCGCVSDCNEHFLGCLYVEAVVRVLGAESEEIKIAQKRLIMVRLV